MTTSSPFGANTELQSRINHTLNAHSEPSTVQLLKDITVHVDQLNAQISDLSARLRRFSTEAHADQPLQKKRKTFASQPATAYCTTTEIQSPLLARIRDISFSIPARKKFTLEIYGKNRSQEGVIRVVNVSSEECESELAFSKIEQIICTPIPERASLAYQYCILPQSPHPVNPDGGIVFSVAPALPPESNIHISDPDLSTKLHSYNNFAPLLNGLFDTALAALDKRVVDPTPDEFVSNIVQAHRKNEKSWGTKAWKGVKEGFLFPLSPGLLFGFKKPVLFFPFSVIESVSYTNVLQRTFNLVVTIIDEDGNTEDVEFSMLNQQDFVPVDEWVKKHQLDDKSLASERRAKVYGVNKPKGERGEGVGEAEQAGRAEGETELAKAERELQDEEDEEEEDYDPGEDGESDGSGTSSEEDGDVMDSENAKAGERGSDGEEEEEEDEEEDA